MSEITSANGHDMTGKLMVNSEGAVQGEVADDVKGLRLLTEKQAPSIWVVHGCISNRSPLFHESMIVDKMQGFGDVSCH